MFVDFLMMVILSYLYPLLPQILLNVKIVLCDLLDLIFKMYQAILLVQN